MRTTALLALTLAACSDGVSDPSATRRVLHEAPYVALAASGDVVLTGQSADLGSPLRYETVDTRTGARTPVTLPDRPGCDVTSYARPYALGDGRFGLLRTCRRVLPERTEDTYELVAYDPSTARITVLGPTPDPVDGIAATAADEVVAVEDSSFCSELRRYRGGRLVPLGITLAADGWPLDEDRARHENDCRQHGLVNLPVTHPRAGLAFVASPDARGHTGKARLESRFGVYVTDGEGVARRVADVDGWPRALAWAVDGESLYVSSDGDRAGGGVHQVSLDGSSRRLTTVVADALAGVADGVVAVEDTEGGAPAALTLLVPRGAETTGNE